MEQSLFNSKCKSFARHCAQHAKHGIVAELDCGIAVYWTQSAMSFTNAFFLSSAVSDEADLRRRLEEIKVYVTKARPTFTWTFFLEPELLPADLRDRSQGICSAAHFELATDYICMQTESLLPPVRPLPNTEIKFATSQQDVYDAISLNCQAYNADTSLAKNVVEHRAFVANVEEQVCCIVSIGGEPVSTATTLLLDDCLYIALVATPAQHCKHGYAEVALRASVERAFETLSRPKHGIVLHATKLGRPVYERMGFKDISHVEKYVHRPAVPI